MDQASVEALWQNVVDFLVPLNSWQHTAVLLVIYGPVAACLFMAWVLEGVRIAESPLIRRIAFRIMVVIAVPVAMATLAAVYIQTEIIIDGVLSGRIPYGRSNPWELAVIFHLAGVPVMTCIMWSLVRSAVRSTALFQKMANMGRK